MERRAPTRRHLFFILLSFLSTTPSFSSHERHLDFFAADPYVQVSSFFDEGSLGECSDNLISADTNEDSRISPDEFALFVGLRSQGQITGLFRQLPVGFIMIFYTAACSICYADTGDDSCCVGSRAQLPLPAEDGAMPPEYMVLLDFLCPNVDDILAPLITKPPTVAPRPTQNPTTTPSQQPTTTSPSVSPTKSESSLELVPSTSPTAVSTDDPTLGPSTSPTVPKTLPPTAQPTMIPTLSPSLSPTNTMTNTPSAKPTGAPTLSPTQAPITDSPTIEPTEAPTKVPTKVPTNPPSLRPTQAPLVLATLRPSVAITSSPTKVPTGAPTLSPTASPSAKPTPTPTVRPTRSPTASPSLQPTLSPTRTPTLSPTLPPTVAPTPLPTGIPTAMPLTENPTFDPTAAPTLSPTLSPTNVPTFEPTLAPTARPLDLLCVSFAYTLQNTTGFTADEIFNEVDNTIKDRLIAATRTVAINILNITQPRIRNPSLNRNRMRALEGRNEAFRQAIIIEFGSMQGSKAVDQTEQLYLPWRKPAKDARPIARLRKRRLAFFSDEFPVEISSILDSMFCATPTQPCVVVSTTVCVLLEAFDDPDFVRTNLIQGFRDSIDGGGFNDVIPRGARRL